MTAIEWTEVTWNPVTGCDRISPGCDHCYALTLAARLKRMGQPRYQRDGDPRTSGPGFGLTLHEDKLGDPLKWRKPRTVFVNSMSDLFHKDVPEDFITGPPRGCPASAGRSRLHPSTEGRVMSEEDRLWWMFVLGAMFGAMCALAIAVIVGWIPA